MHFGRRLERSKQNSLSGKWTEYGNEVKQEGWSRLLYCRNHLLTTCRNSSSKAKYNQTIKTYLILNITLLNSSWRHNFSVRLNERRHEIISITNSQLQIQIQTSSQKTEAILCPYNDVLYSNSIHQVFSLKDTHTLSPLCPFLFVS